MIAPRSISFRLAVWYSAILFAGLALFGAAMWLDLNRTLTAARSRTLTRRAERLSDLLMSTQELSAAQRALKFRQFANATGGGLIEVFTLDGARVFSSPSPVTEAFPWPSVTALADDEFEEVIASGQAYQVLLRPLTAGPEKLILCMAAPLAGNRQLLHKFSSGLVLAIPVLLLISAMGGYLLSRRALVPVDRISAAARSISATSLSQRIPAVQTGDELQRLTDTCNAMLSRVESAVSEIKQFTADASHELRTPVSLIRLTAELGLNKARDEESRQGFQQIVKVCSQASRLLDDMLTLARAEAGRVGSMREAVDLVDLVSMVCSESRSLAAARGHTLTMTADDDIQASVWGDHSGLCRLVLILIENATKYTPSPGVITVSVSGRPGSITVAVEDNGVGISEANLQHLGERFFRVDSSRGEVEGFGLGLAIARTIISAHGARLSIQSKEGEGSRFSVTFAGQEDRVASRLPVCVAPADTCALERQFES